MARSELVDERQAVEVFERNVTHRWHSLETYSPHLIERDVRELFEMCAVEPIGPLAFIRGWMRWQADRKGFGYVVLDKRKAEDAARFALAGILYGLVSTNGTGADRRFERTSADEPMYERNGWGGRLRLPPPQRGGRRVSIDRRHAIVVRPIVATLLRRITDHPNAGRIPMPWIISMGVVPDHLGDRTFMEARDILEGLHEEMYIPDQLRWLSMLRCELLFLGDPPAPEVPMDDLHALMAVA